ncbi:MAG: CDP-glycerol glycerophosphotransferase family protein [Spirochaetaceae bacterium]|nr:CDP-glycerol glycerophosphotransferase family protein [Spirochaetaceae bacterium]
MKLYLTLFFLLIMCFPAFCYIDPGTGSMLLYAIIGISAALLYAFKGYFYELRSKITGKGYNLDSDLSEYDFVFYSESKVYWNVFSPVLENLDKLGKKSIYLTSSNDDLGLSYKSDNITSKYIGEGIKAATYLNNIKADIVTMTTPQLDILTLKKSKKVNHYSYIFHAPTDVGIYGKYAFDNFDSMLCVGKHQITHIREFEEKRKTNQKKLFETGCTYYDVLLKKEQRTEKNQKPVILVAPTWNKNSLLARFGFDILKPLLTEKYKVILRPHPQMYISQKKLIEEIKKESTKYLDLVWDEKPSGEDSMNESDILISDLSGIIFDYAFVYKKPVISIDSTVIDIGLELEDMKIDELWELNIRDKLGKLVKEEEITKLLIYVEELLSSFGKENIESIIKESIYNFGNTGDVAAKQLIELKENLKK